MGRAPPHLFSCLFLVIIARGEWGGDSGESGLHPQVRISLPRHDLLGEERWLISQRRARSLFLSGLLFGLICIGIQRVYIHKAQSLSGHNDQTTDNIQRTMRAYSESGSVS